MEEKKIYTGREVFEQIKDASRKQYIKIWQDFKTFTVGHNFEASQPGEEEFCVLLPYIIYVMQSGRFSQCPAFLSQTAKERDKNYSVKSP
jgi:hypothetical protein